MEKRAPLWRIVVGGSIFGSICIAYLLALLTSDDLMGFILIGAVLSPLIGAAFIFFTVRLVNRRDDPRQSKRPPASR